MEVHPEVYKWLGALQIVDASRPPTINRSGMAALDEDTTMDFENGAVRPATRETRRRRKNGGAAPPASARSP